MKNDLWELYVAIRDALFGETEITGGGACASQLIRIFQQGESACRGLKIKAN